MLIYSNQFIDDTIKQNIILDQTKIWWKNLYAIENSNLKNVIET